MAANHPSDAVDRHDSSSDDKIPVALETTPFEESILQTTETRARLQSLNLSTEPHIIQELLHSVERNSRALASEHERSKFFTETIMHLKEYLEQGEQERQSFHEAVRQLTEEVRKRDATIQQREARIVKLESQMGRLEMALEEERTTSYEGILLHEIKDFPSAKADAIRGPTSYYTRPFYTSRHGYKMCARIYLNGDGAGKGSHFSVFFAIKKGQYDNYLKWPFQRRVHFILVNQDQGKEDIKDTFRPDATSSSFQKPTKDMNIASGCPLFVSHKVLENPQKGFIKNNTICLKVVVDPN